MALYDELADKYNEIKDTLEHKYIFEPTLDKLFSGINKKDIIDLGCGDGKIDFEMIKRGARKVVGVDNSKEQLKLAKTQGIENCVFLQKDIFNDDLSSLGKFNLVTSFFVLHYAKNVGELETAFESIYNLLERGGKFFGTFSNPKKPELKTKKYGITCEVEGLFDGAKRTFTTYKNNKKHLSIDNYYWTKQTYENSIKKAGFEKTTWKPLIPSEYAIKKFSKDFWKEAIESPYITSLTLEK